MVEDELKKKKIQAPNKHHRDIAIANIYVCTLSQWSIPRAHFKINGDLFVVHDSYSFQGRATVLIFFFVFTVLTRCACELVAVVVIAVAVAAVVAAACLAASLTHSELHIEVF